VHSNVTGTTQVKVVPFPPTGAAWQISRDGGVQPRWSADGNTLYYLDPNGRMMAARIPDSDPRRAAAPEALFPTTLVPSDATDQFAVLREGFLIRMPVTTTVDPTPVQAVVNWKAIVP